jgi:hypothetical protein
MIEGVEHHLVIMPARVQAVKVGDAVNAEQDRLAIDNERAFAVPQRRLRYQGIARSQSHFNDEIGRLLRRCVT